MNRIRKYFNNLSVKKKIVSYTYLVICPILLLICAVLAIDNYGGTRQERQETNLNQVQRLSESVALILKDVSDLSSYIAINQQVTDILTADDADGLNQDSRLWSRVESMQMVLDMMALRGYIKSVALYPENGVLSYLRCTDTSAHIQEFETVKQTRIYQKALANRGRTTWNYMPKGSSEVFFYSISDKLVLSRVVFDLTKTRPLGYLVLGIPVETLEKQCEYIIQPGEGIVMLNRDGELLLRYGDLDEEFVNNLVKDLADRLADSRELRQMISWQGKDIYITQDGKDSVTICKVVPQVSIGAVLTKIIYIPLLLAAGVLLGLFPVLSLVSNLVTRPLGNVCEAMGRFRTGDFTQQLVVDTGDEVGEVAACFNKMVTDIKALIDKNYLMALREKESELTTLQAQINPHFLYNTLDVLYWQACDAGNEEIAENIYALSQLFRLVLGQGKGSIAVSGEGELITRYLEIQKLRFSKKLDYVVHIEEEIKNQIIPKLILQPFVENAVVHGISKARGLCTLTVTGRRCGNDMEFVIHDTGIGMSQEQIEAIWQKAEEPRSTDYRIGGYAIYNVRERLVLKYHENFTLLIESKVHKGTRVLMRIPMERGENEDEAADC